MAKHSKVHRVNSTKSGGYPFAAKVGQYKAYTMDALEYARKDAREAMENLRFHDEVASNWYADDVSTIVAEIQRRQKRKLARRENPDWKAIGARFAKGAGIAKKHAAVAGRATAKTARKWAGEAKTAVHAADVQRALRVVKAAGYTVQRKNPSVAAYKFRVQRTTGGSPFECAIAEKDHEGKLRTVNQAKRAVENYYGGLHPVSATYLGPAEASSYVHIK